MTDISTINAQAREAGMTYGKYVIQNEEPVAPKPEPEEGPSQDPADIEERACVQCGKAFVVDLNDGRKKKQIYCSKACSNMAVQARKLAKAKLSVSTAVPDQEAKADAGKPRLTLVLPQIIWDIAEVREYGTAKYGGDPDNWRKVDIQRYREALARHVLAYLTDPTGKDEESRIYHIKHIATNVDFLCQLEEEARNDG